MMEKFAVFAEIIVQSGRAFRMWSVPFSEKITEARRIETLGGHCCWIADFEAPDGDAAQQMAWDQENERLDDHRT